MTENATEGLLIRRNAGSRCRCDEYADIASRRPCASRRLLPVGAANAVHVLCGIRQLCMPADTVPRESSTAVRTIFLDRDQTLFPDTVDQTVYPPESSTTPTSGTR